MAATEKTTNLQLPIYAETDFTDWQDFNDAMEILDGHAGTNDTAIADLKTATENNSNAVSTLNSSVQTLQNAQQGTATTVQNLSNRTTNLEGAVSSLNTSMSGVQSDIENLTDLVSGIPADIGTQLDAIKQKNQQQDTAIATAQSEADTATQTAEAAQTTATAAKNAVDALGPNVNFYQTSVRNTFNTDKIQYYGVGGYSNMTYVATDELCTIIGHILSTDTAPILTTAVTKDFHGGINVPCESFTVTDQTQTNPAIILKPSQGGTTTPLLATLLRYLTAEASSRGSFSLYGWVYNGTDRRNYPCELYASGQNINVYLYEPDGKVLSTFTGSDLLIRF